MLSLSSNTNAWISSWKCHTRCSSYILWCILTVSNTTHVLHLLIYDDDQLSSRCQRWDNAARGNPGCATHTHTFTQNFLSLIQCSKPEKMLVYAALRNLLNYNYFIHRGVGRHKYVIVFFQTCIIFCFEKTYSLDKHRFVRCFNMNYWRCNSFFYMQHLLNYSIFRCIQVVYWKIYVICFAGCKLFFFTVASILKLDEHRSLLLSFYFTVKI